jgi:AmmeMemoRadiSam system protein B/AmmeMemoRadiSam system protein A
MIRPPAVAGRFYPEPSAELAAYIDGELADAQPDTTVKAVVAPHAGYRYSGHTAAQAFRRVAQAGWRRVVLAGPSHTDAFDAISIAPYAAYRTPLGDMPVDTEACDRLFAASDVFTQRRRAHQPEWALEVEIPFLQRLLPDAAIVPLLYGPRLSWDATAAAADALAPLWADPETLFVISSDFTHYGEAFRYRPFTAAEAPSRLEALDGKAIAGIIGNDRQRFIDAIDETGATVCGRLPIATLLALTAGERRRMTVQHYTNTGALHGDFERTVSYAGITVADAEEDGVQVLPEDHAPLLALAADSLRAAVDGERILPPDGLPDRLYARGAAFVTLKKEGRLRGCIGSLTFTEALVENIINNAYNAARRDPRFPAVTAKELPAIEVSISCLTRPRRIPHVDAFVVGAHGIVFETGDHRGVFLPQVAPELGWDKETTLEQLAQKAGLAATDWRRRDATFSVFETVAIGQ